MFYIEVKSLESPDMTQRPFDLDSDKIKNRREWKTSEFLMIPKIKSALG